MLAKAEIRIAKKKNRFSLFLELELSGALDEEKVILGFSSSSASRLASSRARRFSLAQANFDRSSILNENKRLLVVCILLGQSLGDAIGK